jgi:hypothetical protein
MTTADLASRLGWLPCQTCGTSGQLDSGRPPNALPEFTQKYPCPSCNGIGWLPSPAVLEAMALALRARWLPNFDVTDPLGDDWRRHARAPWEAQARLILEGEK